MVQSRGSFALRVYGQPNTRRSRGRVPSPYARETWHQVRVEPPRIAHITRANVVAVRVRDAVISATDDTLGIAKLALRSHTYSIGHRGRAEEVARCSRIIGRLPYRRRNAASSAAPLMFHMLSAMLIVTPGGRV